VSASSKTDRAAERGEPSAARRVLYFVIFGAVVIGIIVAAAALLLGDLFGRWNSSPLREPKALATDVTIAPFLSLNDNRIFPYGIAYGNGEFYVSLFGGNAVRKVTADGAMRFVAQLDAPAALAFSGNTLYVLDYNQVGAYGSGALKAIAADGTLRNVSDSPAARGLPLFAGLTADKQGNLYLSHPENGTVWRIAPDGAATLFWTAPQVASARPSLTGLAYDRWDDSIIVADSGTGSLYKLITTASGVESQLLYRQQGFDPRALAVDLASRVLIAAWQGDNGTLYRLDATDGLVALAEGFRQPTSVIVVENTAYVVSSGTFGLIGGVEVKPPFRVDAVQLPD
jgi:sugar lactone lactonase YvrE